MLSPPRFFFWSRYNPHRNPTILKLCSSGGCAPPSDHAQRSNSSLLANLNSPQATRKSFPNCYWRLSCLLSRCWEWMTTFWRARAGSSLIRCSSLGEDLGLGFPNWTSGITPFSWRDELPQRLRFYSCRKCQALLKGSFFGLQWFWLDFSTSSPRSDYGLGTGPWDFCLSEDS